MTLRLLVSFAFALASAVRAQQVGTLQSGPEDALGALHDSAAVDWSAGRYPDYLARLGRLLASPGAEAYRGRAALLTGELFRTADVAPDGRMLRVTRNGYFAAYEVGAGRLRRTVILEVIERRARKIGELSGHGLAFSPGGSRVAFVWVDETPEITAARARHDSLFAASGRAAAREAASALAKLEAERARVYVRPVRGGDERSIPTRGLLVTGVTFGADDRTLLITTLPQGDPAASDIYRVDVDSAGAVPRALTDGPGAKSAPVALAGGAWVAYTLAVGQPAEPRAGLRFPAGGETRVIEGSATIAPSRDGQSAAYVQTTPDGEHRLVVEQLSARGARTRILRRGREPMAAPAWSPDGQRLAVQVMPREDWEVFVVPVDGGAETRVTREAQHDVLPRWLGPDRLLVAKGEARHRRSFVIDLAARDTVRMFHNNSLRTVAPEYEWEPSPDGSWVLVVADRDGDTVSPERGVYLVSLRDSVSLAEVRARVARQSRIEADLRARGERTFAGVIGDAARAAAADVSAARIYEYERALFRFDSKHVTKPGNRRAIDYLVATLRSWGYEPELQEFEARGARTANVVVRIPGTADPELVYVASSHFDSVEDGPGADDNTSGTSALLEVARVLRRRPQAATIELAWFTGEEAGLLGSREYVRRAVATGKRIVGALNNDMVGWANDLRRDNTIRYSNDGIRDLQHAAAFLFGGLITYDSRYYQRTDAHAYYEQYGDIVGGIGSYPILGNPHYHRAHDVLETIDHEQVAAVARTTVATLAALASTPSRVAGLRAERRAGAIALAWTASPERGVRRYDVAYAAVDGTPTSFSTSAPRATLGTARRPPPRAGSRVAVRAVVDGGRGGWDWAYVTVP